MSRTTTITIGGCQYETLEIGTRFGKYYTTTVRQSEADAAVAAALYGGAVASLRSELLLEALKLPVRDITLTSDMWLHSMVRESDGLHLWRVVPDDIMTAYIVDGVFTAHKRYSHKDGSVAALKEAIKRND